MTNKTNKSPKKDPKFKKYYEMYIDQIQDRENYKEGHLVQLRILIDLLIDYDELTNFVRENGWSYTTESRNGVQNKPYSEVAQRQKTINQIRDYSKLLGITLAKDTDTGEDEEDDDDWE